MTVGKERQVKNKKVILHIHMEFFQETDESETIKLPLIIKVFKLFSRFSPSDLSYFILRV